MKRLLLMLCSAAALAAPLAIAPPALAGTYHMTMDTSKSTDGWTLAHDNGFWGCSFSSRPGPCADADVPAPTSLRLFARGDVNAGDLAFWSWEGPPTVSIASGSVTVNYATTADTRVFMKARLRNFAYASQPQLHTASDDGTAIWKIPAGNSNVGLFLTSLADHSFSNKWSNTMRVVSIDAMLRDDTAPVATVTGPLASGQWLNQAQAVCATVSASDAGSGVASSQLRDNLDFAAGLARAGHRRRGAARRPQLHARSLPDSVPPERRQPRPRSEGGRRRRRGGGSAVHDPRRQPRTHGHRDVPGRHHATTACGQLLGRSRPQRPVRLPGVGGRPGDGRQRRGCLLPASRPTLPSARIPSPGAPPTRPATTATGSGRSGWWTPSRRR